MAADVEKYISLAEIAYKSGNTAAAVRHAKTALQCDISPAMTTSLRIFIARAYSKMGKIKESNTVYRALLNEKNYLPPIIMGLLCNNLKSKELDAGKLHGNIGLVKIFVGHK